MVDNQGKIVYNKDTNKERKGKQNENDDYTRKSKRSYKHSY